MTRTLGQIIRDSFSGGYQRFRDGTLDTARFVTMAFIVVAGTFALYMAVLQHLSLDTLVMTAMLAVACGTFIYDIVKRRRVIDDLSERYKTLEHSHNKIVHEVARHRYGVNVLKDGLNAVIEESPGIRLSENQRILAVKNSLSALDSADKNNTHAQYGGNILKLEIRPQKRVAKAANDLDKELGLDFTQYDARTIQRKLREAVRAGRTQLFMQPVVKLPMRQSSLYEVYSRIRISPGVYMPAAHFLKHIEDDKQLAAIDNIMLFNTIKLIKKRIEKDLHDQSSYILNISPTALRDRNFMADLLSFLTYRKEVARQLIFEMPQSAYETLSDGTLAIVKGLGKIGCRFSMDRLHSTEINIDFLRKCGIRFIKMDSLWMLREMQTPHGIRRLVSLKTHLNQSGIDLIVEKIEAEEDLRKLHDLSLDYGQGYLFGKPDMTIAPLHEKQSA